MKAYAIPVLQGCHRISQHPDENKLQRAHQCDNRGGGYVRIMADAIDQFKKGDRTAADEFVKTAQEYINLLNQHIYKENNVLFSLAEKHLSKEELARLSEGFELIETQKIDLGRHDEFHKILINLENVYLT